MTNSGTVDTRINPIDFAKKSLEDGAGEILINNIDNDIESYAVFLGTDSDSLELMAENLSSGSFQVSLNGGETYYWRVITKDGEGNTSESPIGQFRTTP